MKKIPDDMNAILTEIDASLKAEGVAPHARPLRAVLEFGNRFEISVPLTKSIVPGAPEELIETVHYSRQIHEWYEDIYGDRLKFDPAANARVAIYADGDIWEGSIPIMLGGLIAPSRDLRIVSEKNTQGPKIFNPCAHLAGITQSRLSRFSNDDINEVVLMYNLGFRARKVFKMFLKHDVLFAKAEADWSAATLHLTAQKPDFGQSLYSSSQMAEKYMKGLIALIGEGNPKQRHDLQKLFNELEKSLEGISEISKLLEALPQKASARYEYSSNLQEAYLAHKASLELVGTLGSAVGWQTFSTTI